MAANGNLQAEPMDVAVVEGDPQQQVALRELLKGAGYRVGEASSSGAIEALLGQYHPRVLICERHLPDADGLALCMQLRTDPHLDGTYLVMLARDRDHRLRNEALHAGVDDYLFKPFDDDELLARVRNGMRIAALQDRLRRAASTDGLTGLANHVEFRDVLGREFARARRYGGAVSLLMLDLDHFKAVNDTYGHEAGNEVLRLVAQQLRDLVRETDAVARYGGEEFAVICPQTSMGDAAHLADRIRDAISHRVRLPGKGRGAVTVSVGVATSTEPSVFTVADLINRADHALYVGKRGGRNMVVRSDAAGDITLHGGIEVQEVERLQKQVLSLSMQAKELCLQSVWAFVQALEARDPFTAWHSRNTTFYTAAMAKAAGWDEHLCTIACNAAMLHDLGKIGVPDRILQSPQPVDESDAAILRHVPLMTCKILEPLRVFETEMVIVRHLRERFDGTGFPLGLGGQAIPVGARLVAVAETFDALTSDRPHRGSVSLDNALELVQAEAGRQFDPRFTTLLAEVATASRDTWMARIDRLRVELERTLSIPTSN